VHEFDPARFIPTGIGEKMYVKDGNPEDYRMTIDETNKMRYVLKNLHRQNPNWTDVHLRELEFKYRIELAEKKKKIREGLAEYN